MTKIKILITPIIALLLTSCANSLSTNATAESIQALDSVCMAFEDNSTPSWDHLEESGLDDLWRSFRARHQDEQNRSIVIFIDGTGNTELSKTNIWKLYTLAVEQGCTNAVIPFYQQGVGTRFGNKLLGGVFGDGVDNYIQRNYQVIAQTYKPGDKIFIFGFSRGAYIARSLNGMIEFAGLLKVDMKNIQESDIREQTTRLFTAYHHLNDGRPQFEQRLYGMIENKVGDIPVYRGLEKVTIEAIGVFDTVPALGIGRDDNPDNHRTGLYASYGYHALAIDEQRNDFRPLMFDKFNIKEQALSQIWFAGAHSDVGGGYPDSDYGLQKLSRDWMLENFSQYGLFVDVAQGLGCEDQRGLCEAGQLHDAFLDNNNTFGRFGIHWRTPDLGDILHGSVLCRYNILDLPEPHEREPDSIYRPENLIYPLVGSYEFTDFPCSEVAKGKGQ
jgi:hypothetical protein